MREFILNPPQNLSFSKIKIYNFPSQDWIFQGLAQTPFFIYFPAKMVVLGLRKFNLSFNLVLFTFSPQGVGKIMFSKNRMLEGAKEILKRELTSENYLEKLISDWQKAFQEFLLSYQRILKIDLALLGDFELGNLFLDFSDKYEAEYIPPLVTEFFIPFSDLEISHFISQNPQNSKEIEILSLPTEKTFITSEEEELLKIVLLLDSKQQEKKLKTHWEKYLWIRANYRDVDPISIEYFRRRIQKIDPLQARKKLSEIENFWKNLAQNKKIALQKLKPEKRFQKILEILSKFATWQDKRKMANLMGNFILGRFLREFSKRTKNDFEILKWSLPYEIYQVFIQKKDLTKIFKKRQKYGCVLIIYGDYESVLIEKEARYLFKKIDELQGSAEEIKGIVASPGKVSGIAKIVSDPKATGFRKGEILVTSMTRPDFVPIMKKAAAVVTDEGGLLSHAAIVSRELKIPCIVGTQNATTSLKDGQKIEVDAISGVVKLIESNNG